MVMAKVYFDTVPLSTKVVPADIGFWGTSNINIPPNSSFDTGVLFQAGVPGTYSFAVTTHQHRFGTDMKVWYSSAPGDTTHLLTDSPNWANPPLVMLTPPIQYPAGGTKGLSYECKWMNPSPNTITFGESATQEMCFLWTYYYPGAGFKLCINGLCV
jgi:hypothetical protein